MNCSGVKGIGLINYRNQTGKHSTLTGAKPMKSIKWIIGGSIILGLLEYMAYQACGIWGIVAVTVWLGGIVLILSFCAGASFREFDEQVQCEYEHEHTKGEECPKCVARVTRRFVTKL
jgi:hypothetical protein